MYKNDFSNITTFKYNNTIRFYFSEPGIYNYWILNYFLKLRPTSENKTMEKEVLNFILVTLRKPKVW